MSVHYAWPSYKKPWSAEAAEVQLDGAQSNELVDAGNRRIRLDEREDWAEVALRFSFATDECCPSELQALAGYVMVSSPRTALRRPIRFDELSDGSASATLSLRRAEIAGVVRLRAEFTAEHADRTRLVAKSDEWSLIVDKGDAPAPPGAPPFETKWINFAGPEAPDALTAFPKAYVHMDMSGDKPRLLLNASIDGFQSLLMAQRPQKERRRLKELLGVQIARYSVAAILRDAAQQIALEEDAAAPKTTMQEQVCEAVAEAMASVGSVQQFYTALHSAGRQGGPAYTALWSEIDTALDVLVGVHSSLAGVIKEIKHD